MGLYGKTSVTLPLLALFFLHEHTLQYPGARGFSPTQPLVPTSGTQGNFEEVV